MDEYIKKEDVYQHLDNEVEWKVNQDRLYALEVINDFPAAEVAEVRHGRWIDLNTENSTGPLFKCSECSHLHNPNRNDLKLKRVKLNPLYCDACGARMDKEDEHEVD